MSLQPRRLCNHAILEPKQPSGHSRRTKSGPASRRPKNHFTFIQKNGRGGGSRTRNPWFWKPVLCQLSYAPALQSSMQSSIAALFENSPKAANPSHRNKLPKKPESTAQVARQSPALNLLPPKTETRAEARLSAEQRKRHLQKSQLTLSVVPWHVFHVAAPKLL